MPNTLKNLPNRPNFPNLVTLLDPIDSKLTSLEWRYCHSTTVTFVESLRKLMAVHSSLFVRHWLSDFGLVDAD